MIKFIKKLKIAYILYNTISKIENNRDRTSLYRMLYWKTHFESIPNDEFNKMINDGFLEKVNFNEKSYTWSTKAEKITNLFPNIN